MDYFIRVSDGLLFKRTKDISTGRAYDWYNVGKLRNSGFEFDLNVKLIQKKDWYWDMSVNGYTYANKMLNLPDEYKVSGMPNGNQRIYEGKDIYRWEMRQFAGLDEKGNSLWYMDRDLTDGEGNVVGVEKVTTGDATEATQYLLEKSALPDFTGGLNTTLRWKSLDLTIMTNFQFGGYGFDYDFSAFSSANFPMNRLKNYADAWNPETGKGSAPIWNTNDSNINASSDRFLISKTDEQDRHQERSRVLRLRQRLLRIEAQGLRSPYEHGRSGRDGRFEQRGRYVLFADPHHFGRSQY